MSNDREEGTAVLVQVDRVVPLLDAWQKGAAMGARSRVSSFANGPLNLLAVSGKPNRNKKDGDVATWLRIMGRAPWPALDPSHLICCRTPLLKGQGIRHREQQFCSDAPVWWYTSR